MTTEDLFMIFLFGMVAGYFLRAFDMIVMEQWLREN